MTSPRSGQAGALLAALALAALALALVPGVSGGQVEGAASSAQPLDESPEGLPYASGELLVVFEDAAEESAANVARGVGAEVETTVEEIGAGVLSFPEVSNEEARAARERGLERARRALEESPAVRAADYNYIAEPTFTPNDPRLDEQWGLGKPRFERAWDFTRGGKVRIGIVDTGIDRGHPDVYRKVVAERDFTGNGSAQDDGGHSTHVAGTAAAITDNGRGVAGACPGCRLLVAKSLDDGVGTYSDIIEGVVWTVDNGAKVVNLSLGGQADVQALEDAVDYAWNEGAVVVAAAGNTGDDTVIYPAAYDNALGTAATDRDDRRANFSTTGQSVDIAAPGVGILSTYLRSESPYGTLSGTSTAAPHVSGLAGLMAAQGKSNGRIRARLENTAEDLGPAGDDGLYGAGRIDAARAVFEPPYRQVVDNADRARFSASHGWRGSRNNARKYEFNFRFAKPVRVADPASFKVRTPSKGRYDVFAWWPSAPNHNPRVTYRILAANGAQTKVVNQRRNGGKWVKLGRYKLPRGDAQRVRVQRNTPRNGPIMADAVMVREVR